MSAAATPNVEVAVSSHAAVLNLSVEQSTEGADPAQCRAGPQNVEDTADQASGSAALSSSKLSPSVPAAGKALLAVQKPMSSVADGSTPARKEKRQRTESAEVTPGFLLKDPGLDAEDTEELQESMSHSLQHVREAFSRVVQGSQPDDFHVMMLVHKGDPLSLRFPSIVGSGREDPQLVMQSVGQGAHLSGWQRRTVPGESEEREFFPERMKAISKSVRASSLLSDVEIFLRTSAKVEASQQSSTRTAAPDDAHDPLAQMVLICDIRRRELWCKYPSAYTLHYRQHRPQLPVAFFAFSSSFVSRCQGPHLRPPHPPFRARHLANAH